MYWPRAPMPSSPSVGPLRRDATAWPLLKPPRRRGDGGRICRMSSGSRKIVSAGLRGVLRRYDWVLDKQGTGRLLRFSVRRTSETRVLFYLSPQFSVDGAGSLTPSVRFQTRLRSGARLRSAEKAGLAELACELLLFVETFRMRPAVAMADAALAEKHFGKEGPQSLLRVTSACNQRCPFCFVPLTGRGADWADIEGKLEALARQPNFRGQLTISGGEPTLDPRLPRILEAARKRGFRRIGLQTNGALLSKSGFIKGLTELGVANYLVSFHSHKPQVYDRITATSGQYRRAVEGLVRLVRARGGGADFDVTVNVVVNAWNYRHLPGLADFLGGLGAGLPKNRRLEVYFSMMNEAGHLKVPTWAIDLGRAAPFLRRGVERCLRWGLRVSSFGGESGFPPCLLDDPQRHAMERALPQERVRYAEDFSEEAGLVGRAKHPACRRCPYDSRCLGVPAPYARLFGLGALRAPVDDSGRRSSAAGRAAECQERPAMEEPRSRALRASRNAPHRPRAKSPRATFDSPPIRGR
ncbi:MAG TPA: hypothetical protein DCZ01_08560 [Elusimicrobia bacterium]|nr:hypothetical protein [Elusimicrobiota bacterium]